MNKERIALLIILLFVLSAYVYRIKLENFNSKAKIQKLEYNLIHCQLIDSINIGFTSSSKALLSELKPSPKGLVVIVSENVCFACLENEISLFQSFFTNEEFVFIIPFTLERNLKILLENKHIENYIIINNDIVTNEFAHFSMPVFFFNEYLFIPNKADNEYNIRFYNKVANNLN